MLIKVNGTNFRSFHRALKHTESLANDITLQIFDNDVMVLNKHYDTFSDIHVISESMHFYHNGNLVLSKHVFSNKQACDIIDLFFRKYGAFNYDLKTVSYCNGHMVDGNLTME